MTDVWGDKQYRLSACPGGLLSLVMGWREKDPLTPVWHLSSAQYPESCRGLPMVWNLTPLSYCLHSTPVISTLQNNSLGVHERGSHCKTKSWKKAKSVVLWHRNTCVIPNAMWSIKEIAAVLQHLFCHVGLFITDCFRVNMSCFVALKARETVGRVPVFVIKAVLC